MFLHAALTFINASLPNSDATTLRVVGAPGGARIAAIGEPPHTRDVVIDVNGDLLLPGLINAHDHLELNNFPRLKWRERYDNARDWIADFQPRFKTDPTLIAAMSAPLEDRLLIGGLKNLLSGVTTVAQHNPLHRALRSANFPVRVVRRYGWSHSLGVAGNGNVSASYRTTRTEWPWLIHLAEGIDEAAAAELNQLDALGCLQANTLIVHGVGLSESDRALLLVRGAGLIWCPSSNLFMLGRTADVRELVAHGRVALGSDSRLSGERDLLDELRVAREVGGLDGRTLLELVTKRAASLLRLSEVGALRVGALADLVVISTNRDSSHAWVGRIARGDVQAVVLGGRARYASPRYEQIFAATGTQSALVCIDGHEKFLEHSLTARLRQCSIGAEGVTL